MRHFYIQWVSDYFPTLNMGYQLNLRIIYHDRWKQLLYINRRGHRVAGSVCSLWTAGAVAQTDHKVGQNRWQFRAFILSYSRALLRCGVHRLTITIITDGWVLWGRKTIEQSKYYKNTYIDYRLRHEREIVGSSYLIQRDETGRHWFIWLWVWFMWTVRHTSERIEKIIIRKDKTWLKHILPSFHPKD